MTTTHAEIMQAACNLHDQISNTSFGQAQDVFDYPTPFYPGNHIFHDYTHTGDEVIEELVPHAQLLTFGLFFGC